MPLYTRDVSAPKRVVYIEDNPANFALVRKVLEHLGGYEVVAAATGEEGLVRIREAPTDLVLLDLDLPQMDGFTVARLLRADPAYATVPIVAISASVMKQEREQALAAGCNDFLEKPFDIAQLRAIVVAALSRPGAPAATIPGSTRS